MKQQNANLTKRQTLVLEWNELFPQQGEILSELARIQLGLENQNEALKWFEKAVRSLGSVHKNQNGIANLVNFKPKRVTLNPLSIHLVTRFDMTLKTPTDGPALPISMLVAEITEPRLIQILNKPF